MSTAFSNMHSKEPSFFFLNAVHYILPSLYPSSPYGDELIFLYHMQIGGSGGAYGAYGNYSSGRTSSSGLDTFLTFNFSLLLLVLIFLFNVYDNGFNSHIEV